MKKILGARSYWVEFTNKLGQNSNNHILKKIRKTWSRFRYNPPVFDVGQQICIGTIDNKEIRHALCWNKFSFTTTTNDYFDFRKQRAHQIIG